MAGKQRLTSTLNVNFIRHILDDVIATASKVVGSEHSASQLAGTAAAALAVEAGRPDGARSAPPLTLSIQRTIVRKPAHSAISSAQTLGVERCENSGSAGSERAFDGVSPARTDLPALPVRRRGRNVVQRVNVAIVAIWLRKHVKLLELIPPSIGTEDALQRAHGHATSFVYEMSFLMSDNAPRTTREQRLEDRAGSRSGVLRMGSEDRSTGGVAGRQAKSPSAPESQNPALGALHHEKGLTTTGVESSSAFNGYLPKPLPEPLHDHVHILSNVFVMG